MNDVDIAKIADRVVAELRRRFAEPGDPMRLYIRQAVVDDVTVEMARFRQDMANVLLEAQADGAKRGERIMGVETELKGLRAGMERQGQDIRDTLDEQAKTLTTIAVSIGAARGSVRILLKLGAVVTAVFAVGGALAAGVVWLWHVIVGLIR